MPFSATVYRIFIASPGDVRAERELIRVVIADWNATHAADRGVVLMPVGWETDASPSMDGHPQEVINWQLLSKCDLLVGVFWNRLGTPTPNAPSGTVEEVEKFIASGRPVMLYFSDAETNPSGIDLGQRKKVDRFKAACKKCGLVETFVSREEFRSKFTSHLARVVIERFAGPAVGLPDESEEDEAASVAASLSEKAKEALVKASAPDEGHILFVTVMSGSQVQVGQNVLHSLENHTPRLAAEWRAALQELIDHDLVDGYLSTTGTLTLTAFGYEVAGKIAEQTQPCSLA